MKNLLKRPFNEKKVLDKLGIEDFRHLSKDKVVEFISMLPNMEPEVAKVAIAQFPEFTSTVKSIMVDYKQAIEMALKNNNDSMKACQEAAKSILKSLDKILDNNNLTHEEKMQIIEKMQEVQKMLNDKDSENKKFIRDIVSVAGLVVISVVGATAAIIGSDGKIKLSNKNDS